MYGPTKKAVDDSLMAYRPESMLFSRKHRIATIMRSPATTKRLLLLLWAAFIIRGLWYSAAMPIWEGYDEPYHFAYLQHLAAGGLSPGTAVVSLEVQHSLHLLPLAWELYLQQIGRASRTESDWSSDVCSSDLRICNTLRQGDCLQVPLWFHSKCSIPCTYCR